MEKVKTWTLVKAIFAEVPADWAVIALVFQEFGIEGTVQEDRPPSLSGYSYDDAVISPLSAALIAAGATKVSTKIIEEINWAESWKQFFKPVKIGKRFLVRPTWEEAANLDGRLEIVLDPGQAFGTGDHPTTRMCLELLENADLDGKTLADIGCGSGILTVGAFLLGASGLKAVDTDLPSVESTHENLERNHAEAEVFLGEGFKPVPGQTFDVVISNIISAALIRLAPDAFAAIKPGGLWLVSGIIEANWPDVREAAERNGFRYETHMQEGEWIAARLRR